MIITHITFDISNIKFNVFDFIQNFQYLDCKKHIWIHIIYTYIPYIP